LSTSLPLPNAPLSSSAPGSPIAGNVLPIQRAEELLGTLPGVISARIIAAPNGAVQEIHVLTTTDLLPKQTVRNIESALIAHLGMRVSHKVISVATSTEEMPREPVPAAAGGSGAQPRAIPMVPPASHGAAPRQPVQPRAPQAAPVPLPMAPSVPLVPAADGGQGRRIYFEDVEVRRSRSTGVACRVTLRKGERSHVGEAEGMEAERYRLDIAARATLAAIKLVEGDARSLGLDGCRVIDAFERQWVFVGVTTRQGRETTMLTGSAEIRESAETASVLAVLDATNRWLNSAK
jgi:hypothetical protein